MSSLKACFSIVVKTIVTALRTFCLQFGYWSAAKHSAMRNHRFVFQWKSRLPVTKDIHLEVMRDTLTLQARSVQHAMTFQT